jgi:hypothetical protein
MSTLVKTTKNLDVGHGCTRRQGVSPRAQTRPHACHASSLPGWLDPTRIPNDSTHVTNPDKDDVIMASACTVGMPCQRPISLHVND